MTDEMVAAEELKSTSHQPQRDILPARCICRLDSRLPFPLSFPIGVSITECNSRDSVRHPLLIICSHSLQCLGGASCGREGGRGSGGMCGWNIISMQPTNEPHALYHRRHRRERQMGGGEAAKQVGRSVPRARLSTPRRAQPIHRSAECNMV